MRRLNLHTVCESARCPNIHECFHRGAATFMILGNYCTRGCGFCSVPKGNPAKRDMRLDPAEPANVARMAAEMRLNYVVITSVNRDDLDDGGSHHFAETVREVRRALPDARVEVLTPDFCGDLDAVARVLDAAPHVFNHNMETVPRLYARVRPQANYRQSLEVLSFAKRRSTALVKSGFMVGLGETSDEVELLLRDLREAGDRRRDHRPIPAADPPQSARRRLHRTRAIRRLARLRPLTRFQGRFQRPARAQLVHGRRRQRGSATVAVLNWILALASAALLILTFPRFSIVWFAPLALTPLLIALAREARPARRFLLGWVAGIVYWFGVCYWIQFVLAVHGGVGEVAGWLLLMLFCCAKALHMGVFALLAGILIRRWWALPAIAALWVAIESTHGALGFAWLALGDAGIDMAVPLRLAPFTGVYGLSFLFALTAAALALPFLRRSRLELRGSRFSR